MSLKEYFEEQGINPLLFAARLGISLTSIYRYIRKETCPSRGRAKEISDATNGKVPISELRG